MKKLILLLLGIATTWACTKDCVESEYPDMGTEYWTKSDSNSVYHVGDKTDSIHVIKSIRNEQN
ncbi:MAG: hypothetical protein H6Q13_3408 [Bacteroidetes bacterium]|nr:hypothetical protein [Bacteroidota bacterium]